MNPHKFNVFSSFIWGWQRAWKSLACIYKESYKRLSLKPPIYNVSGNLKSSHIVSSFTKELYLTAQAVGKKGWLSKLVVAVHARQWHHLFLALKWLWYNSTLQGCMNMLLQSSHHCSLLTALPSPGVSWSPPAVSSSNFKTSLLYGAE